LLNNQQHHRKESFRSRLNEALKNTKIEWKPIPVALGVSFLGAWQFYRVQRREKHTQRELDEAQELDPSGKPKKRERIRPSGPWCV
jgi:phosphatidylserine decarboxylase